MKNRANRHTVIGRLGLIKIFCEDFRVKRDRTVRVWLPSDYDGARQEPFNVIYAFDAQNLFDEKTSFIGTEWQLDETVEDYISAGYEGQVIVGIDSCKDRDSELLPSFSYLEGPYDLYGSKGVEPRGELTMRYLIEKVIPYVEAAFNVGRTGKSRTLLGSSLGGLMATLGGYLYPDSFGAVLAFSTAFQLYRNVFGDDRVYYDIVRTYTDRYHRNAFRYVLTSGGRGFEKEFLPYVQTIKDDLCASGYDPKLVDIRINKSFSHNERQWAHFFRLVYPQLALKR